MAFIDTAKQPVSGKIQIKDLKNSIVYNETVKKVRDQERAKAARMEDGELTDSSDNRTPTLSPTPPLSNSFRSPSLSPCRNNLKQKKNDLRLVLKDKEKKRFEDKTCDKSSDDKDKKTYKGVEPKTVKSKTNKHSQGHSTTDGKGLDSKSYTSSRRSKSRDKDRHRDRSRDRSERRDSTRIRDKKRFRSRSNDRAKDKYSRGRSRSRDRKSVKS